MISNSGAERLKKMDIITLDYESRGLDICQFCGFKYNVGDPQRGIIPRSMEEIFKFI